MNKERNTEVEQKMCLHGEVVQRADDIAKLGNDWDDLFERSVDAPPYLSRAWVATFISEGRMRGVPLFILVWCNRKLVALFPLAVRKVLTSRIAEPIGTGEPSYLGLLLDHYYPAAVDYIADLLTSEIVLDSLCIHDLSSYDHTTQTLLQRLVTRGYLCLKTHRNICHHINLGCPYDEYLRKTMSSKRRRELKREERRIYESGDIAIEKYVGEEITPNLVSRLADIQQASWMKRRNAAVLNRSFYRKLILSMAKSDFGYLCIITIDKSDAAFGLGYIAHRRFYYQWTAFDLKYATSLSIGSLVTSTLIRDACDKGLLLYDFGHGDAWYKRSWINDCHDVHRVIAVRGFKGRLVGLCYFVIWLLAKKRWGRQIYHLLRKLLNK